MKFHFGVGQWNVPLKNENKPERDIETSMLQDTRQAFIKQDLR